MSEENRHKIVEREEFTYDEKQKILLKSDERCCKCGKKIFINYGATVDHFVPISKGGTNDEDNLIMLCYDCNQEKGNHIVAPTDKWVKYLKKEEYNKLVKYFDTYLDSFNFLSRQNILMFDELAVSYFDENASNIDFNRLINQQLKKSNKKNKSKTGKNLSAEDIINRNMRTLYIKRLTIKDQEKVIDYLRSVFRKYNIKNYTDEMLSYTSEFFFRFGAVYAMEKNKEIMFLAVIFVEQQTLEYSFKETPTDEAMEYLKTLDGKSPEEVSESLKNRDDIELKYRFPSHFNLLTFIKYNNDQTASLSANTIRKLADRITEENKLNYVPIKVTLMASNNACLYFDIDASSTYENEYGKWMDFGILGESDEFYESGKTRSKLGYNYLNNDDIYDNEENNNFFNQFKDIQKYVNRFYDELDDDMCNKLKWLKNFV